MTPEQEPAFRRRRVYSLTWAQDIVKTLTDKYPRGTEHFLKIYQLKENLLAFYLSTNDPLWPIIRQRIKALDSYHDSLRPDSQDPEDRLDYLTFVRVEKTTVLRKGYERLVQRLDKLYFKSII
jgi:hypothetical protein